MSLETQKKSFAFRRTEQKKAKAKAKATKQETKTKLQCLTEIVTSNSNDYKQERHSSVTSLQSRHAKRARHVKEFATTECSTTLPDKKKLVPILVNCAPSPLYLLTSLSNIAIMDIY
uniref:Uncharacterized protein n=1 Tax=Glossina pallidipes TaxID=7398 RepID=A0A1A9Z7T8_GLOPL